MEELKLPGEGLEKFAKLLQETKDPFNNFQWSSKILPNPHLCDIESATPGKISEIKATFELIIAKSTLKEESTKKQIADLRASLNDLDTSLNDLDNQKTWLLTMLKKWQDFEEELQEPQ